MLYFPDKPINLRAETDNQVITVIVLLSQFN
jgi:hypothetical protein